MAGDLSLSFDNQYPEAVQPVPQDFIAIGVEPGHRGLGMK
jgi:hypothetical protein